MKRITLLACLLCCLTLNAGGKKDFHPEEYVSTLVGTLSDVSFSTGNQYPALALPWGMNFWSPQTGKNGDGWMYSYTAHKIRGFKQTHQPSPWINDYGCFSIMPVTDTTLTSQEARASWFSHKNEEARPYYYQVYLCDPDVNVEMTPTERAAVLRFTYPDSRTSGFVVDPMSEDVRMQIRDDGKTITGFTTFNRGGVPEGFKNFFILTCDKPFAGCFIKDGVLCVCFDTRRGEQVCLRVASSFISPEQAERNLQEVGGRSFDEVCAVAKAIWQETLGRVEVEGTVDQMRTFYSCLYRSTLFPRKFYEIGEDGEPVHYSPYNGEVRKGYLYTDSGFWDVFRAQLPLLDLLYPSTSHEIQEGLACIAEENDFLPEWASPGHRGCMVGNNSASIVAGTYLKGLGTERIDHLYQTLVYATEHLHPTVHSSGRMGHEYYNSLGYIPYNVGINENVARTLEYAYDDWCLLQLARKLGRPQEELDKWAARALNYKNVFDPSVNLMRGRNEDGSFQEPFSPYKWGDAYTEGNAWHYTWSVFHDPQGLIDLMGGKETFVQMLDSVWVVPPIYDDSYYHARIHEITEMQVANMGNYAHGNQPAQHMVYLYDWAGQPWKTQLRAREVMDQLYRCTPDGYCGDEDNGQTSAWYILSALGFYSVNPAADEYAIGSPLFPKATIHLENGRKVVITAKDNGPENVYIAKARLNGRNWTKNYLKYEDLLKGARIKFTMSPVPVKTRGTAPDDAPYSFSKE